MGTVVAFRRFVEIRERHRARAVARQTAERPAPEPGLPAIEGELVPPPVTPPAGRAGRLPLARRGPAKAGPRGAAEE
ncbi:MAG: hypothetical protein IT181_09090 [Acidobacteria bacterium]|nr:hypothetical protein [Acidobacteriota bacterium]